MKLGSIEADEAYDRWHDKMADEYFGADEEECPICGGDEKELDELRADAERFRALRDYSAGFHARYAEAKAAGIDCADVDTTDMHMIPGLVAVISADDFTAAADDLMRPNDRVEGATQLHRGASAGTPG